MKIMDIREVHHILEVEITAPNTMKKADFSKSTFVKNFITKLS